MRLKKLEINGFKSFLEKASIQFPIGISAVVGPNGCGKSNVVDALRWVMGEQSVKTLRGKSMEDVIFAGANGKPPLNMAEVSLILENDNGSAPEELRDFTEIMLTRRLYRSGESVYMLNKQPCRLKDIHNVFMGSGLGSKSYAVIQQGNIGAITDAGPEERRYYIEEAAGTTRFKARKTEALRKIQATNRNIVRISDIITELQRQMNSLKRQARKAELYKDYQRRIKKLDIQLALHRYDRLTRQIEEADALLKNLRDTDLGHNAQLRKLDAAVEEIKLARWKKNEQINDRKNRKFESQRSIDRMENDLGHLRQEIDRLADEGRELSGARETLEEKSRNILTEIDQGERRHAELEKESEGLRTELNRERSASLEIREKLDSLNRALETQKAAHMELISQEVRYKNIHQNAASNRENLDRRLKRTDEEALIAEKNVTAAVELEAQVLRSLEELKQEKSSLETQIESARDRLTTQKKALADQVKTVQTLELEKKATGSKLSALKKMEDNFEWYRDGVRAIMQRPRAGEDASESAGAILGLAADIFSPQPNYETAVEAALGEALQYIIVSDPDAGREAIRYLSDQGAGRSGFIPASEIRPFSETASISADSPHRLLNQVRVKPGFEQIAEALLGHVLVAEEMDDARRLAQGNGVHHTVVTCSGDLVSHQGILVGGSADKLSGILAKKQEIKDLESQIAEMGQRISKAAEIQSAMEAETRRQESGLQQSMASREELAVDLMEAEKRHYKASEDLKNARRHLEITRLEQDQLLGEKSDIDDELAKYNRILEKAAAEVEAARQEVTALTQKVESTAAQLQRFDQKIVDVKMKQTALEARIENSRHTLKRLQEFHRDGEQRLEQLSHEIEQKRSKHREAQTKITQIEASLQEKYGLLENLAQALESDEAEYQTIDTRIRENDGRISKIQSERQKNQEKLRMLELEQSQRHASREGIEQRLIEKYQHDISELRPLVFTPPGEETGAAETAGEQAPAAATSREDLEQMEAQLSRLRTRISRIVDVNLGAIKEYEQLKDRFDFLTTQRDDLVKAVDDLEKVIRHINRITKKLFLETLEQVNEKLQEIFPRLFEGGKASLVLTDPNDPLESGVEYLIQPPGKQLTRMSLLSGGEKALSAIAFVFSIFLLKPTSFCLMDEIDAPLDDANVSRFNELLKIIGQKSQIIMITHNKRTMEFADTLFGITMEKKGISKVVSVNLQKDRPAAPHLN